LREEKQVLKYYHVKQTQVPGNGI